MSLKMKLGATISAFFLILGLMVMGVFASSTAKIELGGNLSFTATNVHAKVNGLVSGAENSQEVSLPELTFVEGRSAEEEEAHEKDVDLWTDADLQFNNNGDSIVIVLTIENLAVDRPVYVTVNTLANMSDLVESEMLIVSSPTDVVGTPYLGDTITLFQQNNTNSTDIAYIRLTISLKDKNSSLPSDTKWGYDISLNNDTTWQTAEEWAERQDGKGLYFELDPETQTAIVSGLRDEEGNSLNYGDIYIPSHVTDEEGNVYLVTTIADFGFCDDWGITSIMMPSSIESIGEEAFGGCWNITNLTIPTSVKKLGGYLFNNCQKITRIEIPASVENLGDDIFGCNRLVEIYNKSGVEITATSFGLDTYYNPHINIYTPSEGSSKLIEIEGYEDYIFFNTGSEYTLVSYIGEETSITLPDDIDFNNDGTSDKYTIRREAFRNLDILTCITIPDSVTSIGEDAFSNCLRLVEIYNKSEVEITSTSFGLDTYNNPDINIYTPSEGSSKLIEIEGYEDYVFFNTGSEYTLVSYTGEETSITLPDNIDFNNDGFSDKYIIRQNAFLRLNKLTSITIPDSVKAIGGVAFWYCSGLTSITIGSGVTSIGTACVAGCSALKDVYYAGSAEDWAKISVEPDNADLTDAAIHYNSTGPSEE